MKPSLKRALRKSVPDHIVAQYGSARAWKRTKREQVRAALKALEAVRMGCAFFPNGSGDVDDATYALRKVQQQVSAGVWGR